MQHLKPTKLSQHPGNYADLFEYVDIVESTESLHVQVEVYAID